MDGVLLAKLDKVLDDVIDTLEESGWPDEAAWYAELRAALLAREPGSPQFVELLVELERSFLGLGTFTDIPLGTRAAMDEVTAAAAHDEHHQRLGLASCASGIIQTIKKSMW